MKRGGQFRFWEVLERVSGLRGVFSLLSASLACFYVSNRLLVFHLCPRGAFHFGLKLHEALVSWTL